MDGHRHVQIESNDQLGPIHISDKAYTYCCLLHTLPFVENTNTLIYSNAVVRDFLFETSATRDVETECLKNVPEY